jgi:predicted secreted protein
MAVIHGNAVGIYVGSDLVACATTANISLSNATIESTCKASTSGDLDDASTRHTIAGQQTWSMQVDGLVDLVAGGTSESSFADLMDLALARTEVTIKFSDGQVGNKEYSGNAFISNIDATAGVDDFVTYSCSLEGNGGLTATTIV